MYVCLETCAPYPKAKVPFSCLLGCPVGATSFPLILHCLLSVLPTLALLHLPFRIRKTRLALLINNITTLQLVTVQRINHKVYYPSIGVAEVRLQDAPQHSSRTHSSGVRSDWFR